MQDTKACADAARLAHLSAIELQTLETDLGRLLGAGEKIVYPDRIWAMGQELDLMAHCYLYGPGRRPAYGRRAALHGARDADCHGRWRNGADMAPGRRLNAQRSSSTHFSRSRNSGSKAGVRGAGAVILRNMKPWPRVAIISIRASMLSADQPG